MKRLLLMALLLTIVAYPAAGVAVGHLDGYAVLSRTQSGEMRSSTSVNYITEVLVCSSGCSYRMSGTHRIRWSRFGDTIAERNWVVSQDTYRGILDSSGGAGGECYFATNDATFQIVAGSLLNVPIPFMPYTLANGGPWQSSSVCFGGGIPSSDQCERNPYGSQCQEPICPLVVNTGNSAWTLTAIENGVLFDMDADGQRDRTGWTAGGASLAFLALDVNGSGSIDDGSELFGEYTLLPGGTRAANGFDALDKHDANGDGRIDARDGVWKQLLLWQDANHDGLSQSHELTRITDSSIVALETGYRATRRLDEFGNELRLKSRRYDDSGRGEPYYDIFFRVQR